MIAMWIGLELTVYGMGLVFLLLAVLWWLIALLVRLDNPTAAVATDGATVPEAVAIPAETSPPGFDPALLSAIFIACRAHRITRRNQAAPALRAHEPGSLPSRWVGSGRTRQNRSWAPRGRYS